jgi:glucose/arabinose dehydrogenase
MGKNLGKIIRLKPDGSVPGDNPFAEKGGVTAQIWSLGHRNLLGLAFDGSDRLWQQEMGPKGGDEVNLVERGANYGYPIVSNGDHYDGKDIPDHPARPEFAAPKLWWNPSISPAGLAWYGGDRYSGWKNSLLMGALSGQGLIRMSIDGDTLHKADRWDFGQRIREVEVREDGSVWLLSDGKNGKLLELVPKG